ncbi:isochorismatase family protein [Pseudomonas entomophila]
MCVASTVRAALAHGYGVVLPHDAHANTAADG